MNAPELLKMLTLLLIDETKKNYRLKELFKEETGKEFNENEDEKEFNNQRFCCKSP